ncbi:hypothetical protein Tco_0311004, partial [Tanacetum coccineum]
LIKKMNEKGVDLSKSEVIKEESKEEVQKENKEDESTRKRKLGTRKKMKSRKRRYIQNTSEDDSDFWMKKKKWIMRYLTENTLSKNGRQNVLELNHRLIKLNTLKRLIKMW